MSFVNKVITHSTDKLIKSIKQSHIVSNGCIAQFCSRFLFNFLVFFQKDLSLEWHYNEVHHRKGSMNGIGGTIKNLVYRKVLSRDVVISTPKKFAKFANEISNVDCLFLLKEQLLKEPEEVAKAAPIQTTLMSHKVKQVKERNSFVNKFLLFE